MRIIKEWNIEGYRFTMFHHNNRYSMKIENGSTEQILKFGDLTADPSNTFLSKSSDKLILNQIINSFKQQEELKQNLLDHLAPEEEEFDTII